MRKILVIGAGRSASSLINYLLIHAPSQNWQVTVGDVSLTLAQQKTKNHPASRAIEFDINNEKQRQEEIKKSDLVISMLPAFMHFQVAKDCVTYKKHLVTASYVSKDIKNLDAEAKKEGIILMNEIGLDPGIDHASAMQVIEDIKQQGGELLSFKSYCGGLIAPESNNNPWGYKFTWNPRNVVLAGQGTAQYIDNGQARLIPYNRLFTQTEKIEVDGYGTFEGYPNRDSLSYREPYGLQNIPTLLRGTLRMPGYCRAWNVFVRLGWTDDSNKINIPPDFTWPQLIQACLPGSGNATIKEQLAAFLREPTDSDVMQKLEWLGLFNNTPIGLSDASPAQLLQHLLEQKWALQPQDKDLIVMQHQFIYTLPDKSKQKRVSSLVVTGEDATYTAMAKTVGLPAAITAKLILNKVIQSRGVVIPTLREIYHPLLKELATLGIVFSEKQQAL